MSIGSTTERFEDIIRAYVRQNKGNDLGGPVAERMFDDPLIGFVSGADPIFADLKKVIGPFHMTPFEVMAEEARKELARTPSAADIGVIVYALPIARSTREENSAMSSAPSRKWAYTRLYGEEFNRGLEGHIADSLREQGYLAVAPELSPSYKILFDENVGATSNWSQRHVAYAAGLGFFGLSDGFITPLGVAHRLGSVVVNVPFLSPEREGLHADCIFFQSGKCMSCAKRCPAGAISKEGHDKEKCRKFVFSQIPYIKDNYNLDIYGCGLCQTRVPCEERSPVRHPR